jgi:hydrogenase nickel incorporation protein HypA/HybF
MHEMSVAKNILDIVHEHIRSEEESKVRSIILKVGELSGIVSDSLEFCFSTLVDNTPLRGAKLLIQTIPISAACNSCNYISQLEYGIFFCEKCHSSDIKLITGKELQIEQIELED